MYINYKYLLPDTCNLYFIIFLIFDIIFKKVQQKRILKSWCTLNIDDNIYTIIF